MANVINAVTNIATMLSVYAFKSVPVYAADLPPRNLYTLNLDESIGTLGQSVVTRVPTSQFAVTANNLANGWGNLQPSSSNIRAVKSRTRGTLITAIAHMVHRLSRATSQKPSPCPKPT